MLFYYLFSSSFLWALVFLGVALFLNSKINRISDKLEKLEKSGRVRATEGAVPIPTSPTTPPSPSEQRLGTPPLGSFSEQAGGEAETPVFPKPVEKEKIDGEEKGGQWLGKIGTVAILLGVSFFLKWSFDNGLIGPMGRVILGIIGGIGFVGVGQFLRKKYLNYSDIVSGGGIAILYLTIFASFAFYHFIGSTAAFALMFLVTALSVTLSIIGGTQQLAVLGVFGGFITPLLISTGENNFIGLMGYLTVLDVGILGVAVFKKWNRLNILGFFGTAILFVLWYERFYTEKELAIVFLFLTIFFFIYLAAGIIHNVLWQKDSSNVDLALITCNAAAYGLMSFWLLDYKYHGAMGFFMLLLAVLYAVVAFVACRMNPNDKTLNFYLPGIAVVFLTLAMPLQFSGLWITLAWFLEAALLVGAGSFVRRHSMNIFGIGVYVVGLIRFFTYDSYVRDLTTHLPIFNSQFFLLVIAIVVAYLIGFLMFKHQGEGDEGGRKQGAAVFFVLAHLLTLYMLTMEINTYYEKSLNASQTKYSLAQKDFYVAQENFYQNGGAGLSERQQAERNRNEQAFYAEQSSTRNTRNTLVSILWALYAAVLTAVGFTAKRRLVRLLGLILFFVTAFKVLVDVWALGQIYRIISSISFGVIALLMSFVYAKYKHRLKE